MNLKNRMYRVSDSRKVKDNGYDDYENYLKSTPEGKKHDEAWERLESFAETFEPIILDENWEDEENCVVTLGDENSSIQLLVNCYGTHDEGLQDWAIINDYKGKGLPDDNFFLANAIRNKITHDDELGDKLFFDIYNYLSENLVFGSNDSDEIYDSRKVKDDYAQENDDEIDGIDYTINRFGGSPQEREMWNDLCDDINDAIEIAESENLGNFAIGVEGWKGKGFDLSDEIKAILKNSSIEEDVRIISTEEKQGSYPIVTIIISSLYYNNSLKTNEVSPFGILIKAKYVKQYRHLYALSAKVCDMRLFFEQYVDSEDWLY